jgi:hypothetical protein
MTRWRPCEGEKQDDTGAWYCPKDPEWDGYDCEQCQQAYDAAVDREVDRLREEADDKRASWG